MRFNELKPGRGATRERKRVGRGMASGSGKTCGRGHKGQKSRSGGGPSRGFEGGQMPLQRRLPKFGFSSRKARFVDEIRLGAISRLGLDVVDLAALKSAGLIGKRIRRVKVIASGSADKALQLRGLAVTKGARAAVEAAGGTIED